MSDPETKVWFSRVAGECMDSLYGLALRLTRNTANAEDLVAETVARAWSAVGNLEDRKRFRPWLFRILHNCYISDYRKKLVRPVEFSYDDISNDGEEDDLTDLLLSQGDDFLAWWGNPEREFANKLLCDDILSAIAMLPDAFRIAILLVTVEGLSYDEAAEVLEVPPGTIRSRMKRGRTLLQKALWQHAVEAGLVIDNEMRGCRK